MRVFALRARVRVGLAIVMINTLKWHRAAGPPANTSYRSAEMVCSRWSRIFVKNFTIFEGGRAAGQYELPLG
jgi:hypothetical protein